MIQGDLLIAPRRVVLPPALPSPALPSSALPSPALPSPQWDDAVQALAECGARGDRAFRRHALELGVATAAVLFAGVGAALSGG